MNAPIPAESASAIDFDLVEQAIEEATDCVIQMHADQRHQERDAEHAMSVLMTLLAAKVSVRRAADHG